MTDNTKPLPPLPTCRDLQGNLITVKDLPSPNTVRWVASKKAILVRAVQNGLLTREEVLDRYQMEEKEFALWEKEFAEYGATGLKTTYYQKRRK